MELLSTEVEGEEAQSIGDFPGYVPTEVDMKLKEVYNNYLVHQNDGSHLLGGGIQDNEIWQDCYSNGAAISKMQGMETGEQRGKTFT